MSTIALLGGTGRQGRGLGLRLALSGHQVIIGSRSKARAEDTARRMRQSLGDDASSILGSTNVEAAQAADVAFICLPANALEVALAGLAAALRGKTVVDLVNPVTRTDEGFQLLRLDAASAAELVQLRLPAADVVSAFKTVSATHLLDVASPLHGDILVCGDVPAAKDAVCAMVARMPDLRAVDAGPLRNARHVEAATVLLLEINRRYGATTSLRVLGLDDTPLR